MLHRRLALPDHPLRHRLGHELHARPFVPVSGPVRVTCLALSADSIGQQAHRDHLAALAGRLGAQLPAVLGDHVLLTLPGLTVRWERHTEFVAWTVFAQGVPDPARPFDAPALDLLPRDWIEALPGHLIVAVHAVLLPGPPGGRAMEGLAEPFGTDNLAAAIMAGGNAVAFTDFRIHGDGFSRILVDDLALGVHQAGRLLQRLLEIEIYRTMALLGLPNAREAGPELTRLDARIAAVTAELVDETGIADENRLLDELTRVAAEVERLSAANSFRFGATRAYYALVRNRLDEAREQRVPGFQTWSEFLDRRLAPAIRTCDSVAERMENLSVRVTRASQLLRARVDVALQAQNQTLLQSMDRRAALQLRLQETVEGLSVVAISYYLLGLVGYLAKGGKAVGLPIDPDLLSALAIPVVLGGIYLAVRRVRRAVTSPATHDHAA